MLIGHQLMASETGTRMVAKWTTIITDDKTIETSGKFQITGKDWRRDGDNHQNRG